MSVVLADTGPLVALLDPRDRLHVRARREFEQLSAEPLVGLPTLTEVHFFLNAPQRARLAAAIQEGLIRLATPAEPEAVVGRCFEWLERYRTHRPDFVDAFLIAWAESVPRSLVWTFDAEFETIWRTLSGRRVTRVMSR